VELPTAELVEGFAVIVPASSTTANDVGLTLCSQALIGFVKSKKQNIYI